MSHSWYHHIFSITREMSYNKQALTIRSINYDRLHTTTKKIKFKNMWHREGVGGDVLDVFLQSKI
jgi:hypothetical protein